MAYAQRTKVHATLTKTEIERTLRKYGAAKFAYADLGDRAVIQFEASERRIRFDLPLPSGSKEQEVNRRWRALLLCIKAKLESVASKIETFEEAFLAHVVLADGSTVYQHARGSLKQIYDSGSMVPLLPGPKESSDG